MSDNERPTSLTVIGWLWVIAGGVLCVGSLMPIAASLSARRMSPDSAGPDALALLLKPSSILALTLSGLGLVGLVCGWRLLKLREWARKVLRLLTALLFAAVIAFAAFLLIGIPVSLSSGSPSEFTFLAAGVGLVNAAIIGVPLGMVLKSLGSETVRRAMRRPVEHVAPPASGEQASYACADSDSRGGAPKSPLGTAIKMLSLAVMMAAVAVIMFVGSRALSSTETLDRQYYALEDQMHTIIALLSAESIRTVTTYEDWHPANHVLDRVSDPEQLRMFVSALQNLEPWSPQHPSCTREFYVVVDLGNDRKLEYLFRLHGDKLVYISFVRKHRRGLMYLGHASSRPLYTWLEERGILHSHEASRQ